MRSVWEARVFCKVASTDVNRSTSADMLLKKEENEVIALVVVFVRLFDGIGGACGEENSGSVALVGCMLCWRSTIN